MAQEITRAAFCELTGIQVEPRFTGVTLFGWMDGKGQAIETFIFVEDGTVSTEIAWLDRLYSLKQK